MGRVLLLLVAVCLGLPSLAYVPTRSANGNFVKWNGQPVLNLAANPSNLNGLSNDQISNAVVRSLQRWKQASSLVADFNFWLGTDPKDFPATSQYDGISSVYFASSSRVGVGVGPAVLGLTQVWYSTTSGEIYETDIVLNDRDYFFTTNPTDSTGYGSERIWGEEGNKVYIENVLTHEIGHAFGLSHSSALQSTMLFMEASEQAHLSCDEMTAIHALYPSSDASLRGRISGTLLDPYSRPVVGAYVQAISRLRGTTLATALSDRQGRYVLEALEPGDYFIMAEPFLGGASVLPSYYSNMNPRVCPGGRSFRKSFLLQSIEGALLPIGVNAGEQSVAPDLVARCDDYYYGGSTQTLPEIYSPQRRAIGWFSKTFGGISESYRLSGVVGRLELHGISYSLFSPIEIRMELYDEKGQRVGESGRGHVDRGDSGFVNYDSQMIIENLPIGNYTLKITSESLSPALYPLGPGYVDSDPFYVIAGGVNDSAPVLQSSLPLGPRCRQQESYASYQSPAGSPTRSNSNGEDSVVGFCGSIKKVSPKGFENAPSWDRQMAQRIGWALPWLVMMAMAIFARRLVFLAPRRQ